MLLATHAGAPAVHDVLVIEAVHPEALSQPRVVANRTAREHVVVVPALQAMAEPTQDAEVLEATHASVT